MAWYGLVRYVAVNIKVECCVGEINVQFIMVHSVYIHISSKNDPYLFKKSSQPKNCFGVLKHNIKEPLQS